MHLSGAWRVLTSGGGDHVDGSDQAGGASRRRLGLAAAPFDLVLPRGAQRNPRRGGPRQDQPRQATVGRPSGRRGDALHRRAGSRGPVPRRGRRRVRPTLPRPARRLRRRAARAQGSPRLPRRTGDARWCCCASSATVATATAACSPSGGSTRPARSSRSSGERGVEVVGGAPPPGRWAECTDRRLPSRSGATVGGHGVSTELMTLDRRRHGRSCGTHPPLRPCRQPEQPSRDAGATAALRSRAPSRLYARSRCPTGTSSLMRQGTSTSR